ncbi:MAG: inorganic phosphate transporter [Weeksellaceae bacterium]|nr:inorganic phosphate transporter [Weeksellaceae bacterium]
MENIYVFIVGLLALFAIFDLIVGVSNDAVNFLNSAVGSKVAKFKVIILVASLGIMMGALTSGGMMEVTRKGIYNPEYFYFNEVMLLFMAVMIADIVLLDLFNTFGFPTSTTVSIVFEMLGAALALSVIKIVQNDLPLNYLFNIDAPDKGIIGYMNWSKTTDIISGILLSVVIAFTIGVVVQFIVRMFFSFKLDQRMRVVGSLWSGTALTAILYFLLFKGMGSVVKGVAPENMSAFQRNYNVFHEFMETNLLPFFGTIWILFMAAMFVIQRFKINPLRLVVLFGTFALAMAFAGNDLVNFIGVPIAGWQSFQIWQASGQAPNELLMTGLAGEVTTPYILMAIAGVIMTLTLWFSKKARSVTETEVNLGAQSEVEERFKANTLARGVVNSTSYMVRKAYGLIPQGVKRRISNNFESAEDIEHTETSPHFDLVRASVNLVMAAILIAVATDMKLPLSTTYVSFMVAMGTSLADRAWGRESAVYRISGVLNVIAGWFLTAFMASSIAAIFVCIMYFGGIYGIVFLMLLLGFVIYKTSRFHTQKLLKRAKVESKRDLINYKDVNESLGLLTENLDFALGEIRRTLELTHVGLAKENRRALKEANKKLVELDMDYAMVKDGLFRVIKKNKSDKTTSSHLYVLTYDLMQDLMQSLSLIVKVCTDHVHNNHKPLTGEQRDMVDKLRENFDDYFALTKQVIASGEFTETNLSAVVAKKNAILQQVEDATSMQIQGIMDKKYGFKNTSLYFTLLLEMKDLVAVTARFVKLYSRVYQQK